METPYDWGTIIIFAGLIVLFLQRSQGEPRDQLWQYLVPSLGCMATNFVGNEAIKADNMLFHAGAIGLAVATLAWIWLVLKPMSDQN